MSLTPISAHSAAHSAFNRHFVNPANPRRARARCAAELETARAPARATARAAIRCARRQIRARWVTARRNDALAALALAHRSTRGPCTRWGRRRIQRSEGGGGAREANEECGGSPSSARCSRWERIRSINAGSSILAITLRRPPQRPQRSRSIANTRLSRCAQVIEHPVVSGEMHAQRRYERGQARQKVERLQNDVRRAVAIGSLELQAHIALGGEREPLNRDGGGGSRSGRAVQASRLAPLRRWCRRGAKSPRTARHLSSAPPLTVPARFAA